jgi:hypothetical protein
VSRPTTPLARRLWSRVQIRGSGECWLWTGGQNSVGYGVIRRGRKDEGIALVHRAAWESVRGPIPPGMTIDHACRIRLCCNPNHLEVVTLSENSRDGANHRWRNQKGTP